MGRADLDSLLPAGYYFFYLQVFAGCGAPFNNSNPSMDKQSV